MMPSGPDGRGDTQQMLEQWLEQIAPKRVLRIALSAGGILVNFKENGVHASCDRGCGERFNIFGFTCGDTVAATR